MNSKELRTQSETELNKKLGELKKSVLAMQFSLANRQLKAVRDLRKAKKNIARVMTEITSRANRAA